MESNPDVQNLALDFGHLTPYHPSMSSSLKIDPHLTLATVKAQEPIQDFLGPNLCSHASSPTLQAFFTEVAEIVELVTEQMSAT